MFVYIAASLVRDGYCLLRLIRKEEEEDRSRKGAEDAKRMVFARRGAENAEIIFL